MPTGKKSVPAAAPAEPTKEPTGPLTPMDQVKQVAEKALPYLRATRPYLRKAHDGYVEYAPKAKAMYQQVPQEYLPDSDLLLAMTLLFFGGQFSLCICAFKAFQMSGARLIGKSWAELKESYATSMTTLREDPELVKLFDSDGDCHITFQEVIWVFYAAAIAEKPEDKEKRIRILGAVMKCVDPQKLLDAFAGFWAGASAVLATLRSQMARYVTIGAQLGTHITGLIKEKTAKHFEEKFPENIKWVHAVFHMVGVVVGVLIAFVLTRFIMAVSSAMEGSKVLGDRLLKVLQARGMLSPEQILAYGEYPRLGLFAIGMLFQISQGFSVPWYFKIFLFPGLIAESSLAVVAILP